MADRKLVVEVIGDDRSFRQALNRSTVATTQFESRFTRLNQSLRGGLAGSGLGARGSLLFGSGAFIGTAAISSALAKSVNAASDLNEAITKSQQIFKDSASDVLDWSRTTAAAMGVSRRQALETASTFGNLLTTVGLAPAKTAEMSKALVQLGADLASFNNTTIDDALQAIRSGLVGEAEPLRRFGVLLSETRVQQQAMADTGKKTVKSLTDQEKALARYEIILQDTIPAQGDFSRTSGGLANQSRVLQANLEDLSATIGSTMVPALAAGVGGLNDLIEGMNRSIIAAGRLRDALSDTHAFDGFNSAVEGGTTGLSRFFLKIREGIPFVNQLRDAIQNLNQAVPDVSGTRDESITGSPGAVSRSNALVDAQAAERARKAAAAALERARRQFAEHIKGLGLKLDKAELTRSTADDLAVLREIEASILRRIAAEGRTFKLVQQLTDIRKQIATVLEQQAADAAQASSDAFSNALDALNLQLDIAKARKGFNDDLRALEAIERLILQRIVAEGRTTDLLRQLFENRQEQARTRQQMIQAQQFEGLGLTAEGEQRTPSAGALLRRTRSLQDQIKGTVLDTEKTRSQLQRIVRVLKGEFGAVGRDVRQAILRMLNDISGALSGGTGDINRGNLTKFRVVNTSNILKGLGLDEEQTMELRRRLSRLGPGGTMPQTTTTGGAFGRLPEGRTARGGGFTVNFNGPVTIQADDPNQLKRQLDKRASRNSGSRTGPRSTHRN